MAKGQQAKETIGNLIIETLGDKFITVQDKKIYCWEDDGGEKVQVAISMTVPKTFIEIDNCQAVSAASSPIELNQEDKTKVNELLQRLGFAT
jgi:predicted ATP-binding protein involved in virulence